MKKLRLDVDALQVESFAPLAEQAPLRGTVEGNVIGFEPKRDSLGESGCDIFTPCCPTNNLESCYDTCGSTCVSCELTCGSECYQSGAQTCICASHHNTECHCPPFTSVCA